MTKNDDQSKEITNVDLQFMGQSDEKRDLRATVQAESKAAKVSANPEKVGLDDHDVSVAQSMDASDPPSSNMGAES